MKRFKKLSFVFTSVLLAGFVTFSACKKDDDDDGKSVGTKAGEEVCNCLTKAGDNETALAKCMTDYVTKYATEIAKSEDDFYEDFYKSLENCAAYGE